MSLRCHAYILTADQEVMYNPLLCSDALKSFKSFVGFSNSVNTSHINGSPLLLAVTKVDQIEQGRDRTNLPEYCIQDSYPKSLRRELSVIRNTGLATLVDKLAEHNYLTTMTCSAYGFPPLPCDNVEKGIFTQRENKEEWKQAYREKNPDVEEEMIPHPVYKKAQPRNVDMILSWLEKLFGIQKIMYDSINGYTEIQDLSTVSRFQGHFDDVTVSMIASMFCNPNDCDAEWYESIGESRFFRNRKQNQLMRRYKQ